MGQWKAQARVTRISRSERMPEAPWSFGTFQPFEQVFYKLFLRPLRLTLHSATDLMALTKLAPPSSWGCDIAVGSAQRFGVPMGFGGPHAGFLSTSDKYSRKMPGRIIGVTIDSEGKPCLRMAMQTREQVGLRLKLDNVLKQEYE